MDTSKLQLYFKMGTKDVGEKEPLKVVEDALKGGITSFQLREVVDGALSGSELKEFAKQCKSLCRKHNVPFIIKNDIELALEIGADGVHVDSEDGVVSDIRGKIGPDKLLGVSTSTVKEALEASDAKANYIEVGPLYESKTKQEQGKAVVGLERLKEIKSQLPGLPIVGIGGISERKALDVVGAGASGIVATTEIASAENVEEATRSMKGQILVALTGVEM